MNAPPELKKVARQWIFKLNLDLDLEIIHSLNRCAVDASYPGDYEPFIREEAEQAVETAGRVKAAVKSNLPPDF